MTFQYFSNKINKPIPKGYISLDRFIRAHKQPKEKIIKVFQAINQAEIKGDMKRKAELKQNYLHYFTPCVHLDGGRKYSDIISFTGLMVLDFDHIENAEDLKQHLFNEYKYIITAYLSPSKKGVKCLVSIPKVNSITEFQEHFFAIQEIMECYDGFDVTTKNAVLPLFQSYDNSLLYRNDFETFYGTKTNPNEHMFNPTPYVQVQTSELSERRVIGIIKSMVNKITDNGHPQLRSASLCLGGYVASNYISYTEALSLINSLIDSNAYLCQKPYIYKQTAKWAIERGTTKQLILRD